MNINVGRKIISYLFANHVYSPYSIQMESKTSVITQISGYGAS